MARWVWVHLLGGQGAHAHVILVLRECTWDEPAVSLLLPALDDTESPDYPPRRVIYRPTVSTLVTASRFLAENRETELKPTTFSISTFQCFSVLQLLLQHQLSSASSATCWG